MVKLIKALCYVILTFSATDVIAKSNCYIELLSSETGNMLENRRLIESYGGKIIHEFPETNEYICQMAPAQFMLFAKQNAIFAEHDSIESSIGYTDRKSRSKPLWFRH